MEVSTQEGCALVSSKNGDLVSPAKGSVGCTSPKGFQVLQDLREEGEFEKGEIDEEDKADDEDTGRLIPEAVKGAVGNQDVVDSSTANAQDTLLEAHVVDDESADLMASQKQSSSLRGRGRGSKRRIVSSKGLVHAAVQNQKVQNSKKASSRKH